MTHETTNDDFEVFKEAGKKEVGRLGLSDWKIWFQHDIDIAYNDSCALCLTSYEDKQATIQLNPTWDDKPTKETLEYYGRHEIIELLLADYSYHAESRFAKKEDLNATRHALIQRIINAYK